MYLGHFGLSEPPFAHSSTTDFFYEGATGARRWMRSFMCSRTVRELKALSRSQAMPAAAKPRYAGR